MKWVVFGTLALAAVARAQVPPSGACQALQSCVDSALGTAVTSCVSQNPSCDASNPDELAVAAGVLADRAIAVAGCGAQAFSSRAACVRCYWRAKLPFKLRFDLKPFHGLLAHAAEVVTAREIRRSASLR